MVYSKQKFHDTNMDRNGPSYITQLFLRYMQFVSFKLLTATVSSKKNKNTEFLPM